MSLNGRRVVVTRAPHQAEALAGLLQGRGANPVLYPCIDIALPDDMALLGDALDNLKRYRWAVITSPNTVLVLRNFAVDWGALKLAAVGETTAAAIQRHWGANVDFTPPHQTGASLAETIPLVAGDRVFLPHSALADDTLAADLQARGAEVEAVSAYQNVLGTGGADLPALLKADGIDALTFTSGSTVANLSKRLGNTPAHIPAACIGPSTANAAASAGYQAVVVPQDDYSLTGMLDALAAYFAGA